jgi:hypothetical protein
MPHRIGTHIKVALQSFSATGGRINPSMQRTTALCAIVALAAAILSLQLSTVSFASSSNTVSATLQLESTCTVALSNTLISFGTVAPASNAPVTNVVADTNDGNIPANILLDGTNWVYQSNSFFVSNTLWDFSPHSGGLTGNTLGLAPGNLVDTTNIISIGEQTDLFFGVFIPSQQAVGTYTQSITIENKC